MRIRSPPAVRTDLLPDGVPDLHSIPTALHDGPLNNARELDNMFNPNLPALDLDFLDAFLARFGDSGQQGATCGGYSANDAAEGRSDTNDLEYLGPPTDYILGTAEAQEMVGNEFLQGLDTGDQSTIVRLLSWIY